MSEIKDGGPAFPAKVYVNHDTGTLQPHQFGNDDFCTTGLSLRDYFAAKAMQGMLASGCTMDIAGEYVFEQRAKTAYAIASAMLRAREAS